MRPWSLPVTPQAPNHPGVDLDNAREALDYWERRERRLPLHALRQRREAREMAARWRADIAAAERAAYGRGLLGALLLLTFEGRVPVAARHAGRQVAHRSKQAAVALVVVLVSFAVVAAIAAIELLVALLHALT